MSIPCVKSFWSFPFSSSSHQWTTHLNNFILSGGFSSCYMAMAPEALCWHLLFCLTCNSWQAHSVGFCPLLPSDYMAFFGDLIQPMASGGSFKLMIPKVMTLTLTFLLSLKHKDPSASLTRSLGSLIETRTEQGQGQVAASPPVLFLLFSHASLSQ